MEVQGSNRFKLVEILHKDVDRNDHWMTIVYANKDASDEWYEHKVYATADVRHIHPSK